MAKAARAVENDSRGNVILSENSGEAISVISQAHTTPLKVQFSTDFKHRNDGESIRQLVRMMKPNKLVIVRGLSMSFA